jgi:hypothetical protein
MQQNGAKCQHDNARLNTARITTALLTISNVLVTHSPVVVKIEAVVVFGEGVCLSRPKDAQMD